MALSIRDFQAAARTGGDIGVRGQGEGQTLVKSRTSWLGRGVAMVSAHTGGASAQQARGEANLLSKTVFYERMVVEYGAATANQVMQDVGIDLHATTPLSSRAVRQAIAQADQARAKGLDDVGRFAMTYSADSVATQTLCATEAPRGPIYTGTFTAAQKAFYNATLAEELSRLSDGGRARVTPEAAKRAALAAAELAANLGDAGAAQVNAARGRLVQDLGRLAQAVQTGAIHDRHQQDGFVDAVLRVKKDAEAIAQLTGRPLDSPQDMAAVLRGPVEAAVGTMSRAEMSALHQVLTAPDGLVHAFREGAASAAASPATQRACARAQATLEGMLDVVGARLGRNADERDADLAAMRSETGTASPDATRCAERLLYRLTPRTYAPAAIDYTALISGPNAQMRADFHTWARHNGYGEEYGPFLDAVHDTLATPTMAGLEGIEAQLDDQNLAGTETAAFRRGLQQLQAQEAHGVPATPVQMLNLLRPLAGNLAAEMNNMNLALPFQTDIAATLQMQ